MTLVESDTGVIVIDPLILVLAATPASASHHLDLDRRLRPGRPVAQVGVEQVQRIPQAEGGGAEGGMTPVTHPQAHRLPLSRRAW